jgi:hypothetical protein
MSADHDRVQVSVRGEKPIEVSRELLAETIQVTSRVARAAGRRPGEPISSNNPNSSDLVATAGVVETTKILKQP